MMKDMDTFKIRVATESDVKEMVSVINKAYESEKVKLEGVPRTDVDEISNTLKREDSHFILLTTTKGKKIVGSVRFFLCFIVMTPLFQYPENRCMSRI